MSSSPRSSDEPGPVAPKVTGPALDALRARAGVAGGSSAPPEKGALRDAATVILLRPEAGGGYSVYLVKRAHAVAFMGGAHVFPGGRVDKKTDASPEAAGCREVLEEAKVRLDPAALIEFARWVTPEVEPKRFDARFYVAVVPADERGGVDQHEVTEGAWLTPMDALLAAERSEIALPPPTLWNLQDLARLPTIDMVLSEARRRVAAGVEVMCPRALEAPALLGRIVLTLPGDPQYDDPAAPEPSEERKRRFELVEGRWRAWR